MIRLTRQTDYGIVLLTRMAAEPAQTVHNARELAAVNHLPLPMVSKILKRCAREGLLVSHRGVKGGYGLARRPEDVSVLDVINAFEGPLEITECTVPGRCEHEPGCTVRNNWVTINDAVRVALSSLSLADMARPLLRQGLVTLSPRRGAAVAACTVPPVTENA